jgi:fluoroquinolone transport system permease protein
LRVLNALKADVCFQFKQGFYLVYIILTIFYMILLGKLPAEWKSILVPLVIFSDPAMVGFFFIGALVMLEKLQGVTQYVVVTPLRSVEYLLAKALSLTLLALAATFLITLTVYNQPLNWFLLIPGVILTSFFFVLYGFVVAAPCVTMNQFFIRMIPFLLLIVLPCFSLVGFPYSWVFNIFPSVAGLKLVYGAFNGIGSAAIAGFTLYLVSANIVMIIYVQKVFDSMVTGGE